jgi:hypothetical protein
MHPAAVGLGRPAVAHHLPPIGDQAAVVDAAGDGKPCRQPRQA